MDRAPASLSRLPFASAVLDRVALHSKLALMFSGARLAGLPARLYVVSNRMCSGNVNTTDHHD
jgi:hypothetical protein